MQEFYVFAFVFAILALSGSFGEIPEQPETIGPEQFVSSQTTF